MDRVEAMAEAIKNAEPNLRLQGRTIDWNRFMGQFNSGMYEDPVLVPMAVENSAADKNDLTPKPESDIL